MSWLRRIGNVVWRRNVADEIDEELQFHVESSIRANIASGMSPDDARRDTLRRFGNLPAVRDRTRDADIIVLLDDLRRDVGFAIGSLRRRPAFVGLALLTLALGIGSTSAVFTVVRSVLLRPLPFADPGAVHVISYSSPGPAWLHPGMSDRGYLAFREETRTFEVLASFAPAQSTLTGFGDATRLAGAAVTTDFFRVLDMTAAIGRTLESDDDQPGHDSVVVISDLLWRRHFGADPGLLTRTITLNGIPHRVIGVLPAGFSYPAEATYWIPLRVQILPNLGYIRPVIGRARAGVTREQAQADLDSWVGSLPPDPQGRRDFVARVTPLQEAMVGDVRLPLLVFGGAVVLVLLIVCANVANLLLMRAVSRRQEIATRLALGASRGRLVRQLLTESALLSTAGGLVGGATALLVGPALLAITPPGYLPGDIDIRPDGWVVAFTAGVSLLTGLIVGLAPMVQTAREGHYLALREGTASATRRSYRLRHALVVAQVALTLTLLVGAGLLVKSVASLRSVPLGFTPDRVMTMTIDLPVARYSTADDVTMLHDRLLQVLAAMPGVQSVGAVNWLPLGDLVISGDVQAEDRPDLGSTSNATKVAVNAGYFETVGIRLLRGRPFTEQDRRGRQPVLIISESVARRFWPDRDPIGRRMALTERPKADEWLTVVGVVEDVRQDGFRTATAPAVYQPYSQVTRRDWLGYMTFLVRTSGDPDQAAPLMRTALAQVDSQEAPQAVATLEAVIDRTVAEPRFQARVLAAFSLAALLLAAIGIYGVLATLVLERRFEIGLRMALGAGRASVIRLVLWRVARLTTAGILAGLGGAWALTGALGTLLFDVTPTDPSAFAVATAVLSAAALGAALRPAWRASTIDPVLALRGG